MADPYFCRCGAIVTSGSCEKCTPAKKTKRPYDRQWRKVRADVMRDQPLCVDCEAAGRVRPAQEVHHVKSVKSSPNDRLDPANLVPLCVACHRRRHGKA